MALIKCEECGKEISDKAKACIHCGCPIESKCEMSHTNYDMKIPVLSVAKTIYYSTVCWNITIKESYFKQGDYLKLYSDEFIGEARVNNVCIKDEKTILTIWYNDKIDIAQLSYVTMIDVEIEGKSRINDIRVKCPTCNSTDVIKISGANKVGSVALFGVFSLGHISKTFKCNECGYKW